ncbi:MAG: anti-sigma factor [Kofleriaceae bacterium]
MKCEQIQRELTAYLEGELEGARGSHVRGHLRGCESCRAVASSEAAVRDGLRSLPPVDPPPSLWSGIQAQLATAEVADAQRPAWRRAFARWAPAFAPFGRFAIGGLVAAGVVAVVWWRSDRTAEPVVAMRPAQVTPPTPVPTSPPGEDVTADLAAEAAANTAAYAKSADELLAIAHEVRAGWPAERQASFDSNVAALQRAVSGAAEGRPRQKALRALIRYLDRAAARDEVALAGGLGQ